MKNKKTAAQEPVKVVETKTTVTTESAPKTAKKPTDSISSGISLILLGVMFLGTTQGWFSWSELFLVFITYWPIAVILWGVRLVFSTTKMPHFLLEIIDVIFPAFVLAVLLLKPANFDTRSYQTTPAADISLYQSSQERAVSEKVISLELGALEFTLDDANMNPGLLFTATQPDKNQPLHYKETLDEKGKYSLIINNYSDAKWTSFRQVKNRSHAIQLGSPSLPTTLDMKLGATHGEVKLSQTYLKNISLSLGAGDVSIASTGMQQPEKVTIVVGAGSAELSFPSTYNIKVTYSVGVGSLSINGKELGGLAANGNYQSNSYAEKTIEVTVKVGAGSVTIKGI
jgi:hypothetical protein